MGLPHKPVKIGWPKFTDSSVLLLDGVTGSVFLLNLDALFLIASISSSIILFHGDNFSFFVCFR